MSFTDRNGRKNRRDRRSRSGRADRGARIAASLGYRARSCSRPTAKSAASPRRSIIAATAWIWAATGSFRNPIGSCAGGRRSLPVAEGQADAGSGAAHQLPAAIARFSRRISTGLLRCGHAGPSTTVADFLSPPVLRLSAQAQCPHAQEHGADRDFAHRLELRPGAALHRSPEVSLEDFLVNRFGERLYRTFFKDYTEKVWGVPATRSPRNGARSASRDCR
jgi:hypothetical protein